MNVKGFLEAALMPFSLINKLRSIVQIMKRIFKTQMAFRKLENQYYFLIFLFKKKYKFI